MSNSEHKITLTVNESGSFTYSGGNDGNKGNVVNNIGGGQAPMQITLEAPAGFKITSVVFTPQGIDWKIHDDHKVKIDNDCKNALDVKYSVIVEDSTGKKILCDPKIINK